MDFLRAIRNSECHKCSIHRERRRIVPGSGSMPADILLIGEAPGKSEDSLGVPFAGLPGRLLKDMIDRATKKSNLENTPTMFITNCIFCRPYVQDKEDPRYLENREPTTKELLNCVNNIELIHQLVKPKLVIFVGNIAQEYYGSKYRNSIKIVHPSAILKTGGMSYQLNIQTLAGAFNSLGELK